VISAGCRVRVQAFLSALTSPGGFAIAVVAYLGILFILRIVLFPGASEDDAETLFLAQSLEGGYKAGQPPLYTWLTYGLTQMFGPALPVVVALKFLCLGGIYCLSYRLAHLFTGDRSWAAIAGLSVIGIYYLSWDAVLNYSQTVLLAMLALTLVYMLVRIAANASGWVAFIWLGVIVGAGMMTKYNFAGLFIAVLAAALMDRDLRGKLLSGYGLAAVLIAVAMVLPHISWVLDGGLQPGTLSNVVPASDGSVAIRFAAFLDIGMAIVSILSPLLILVILFFPGAAWRAEETDEFRLRCRKFCERSFWILLTLIMAAVVVSGISEVRNHWFIVLAPFPAYAVLRISAVYPLKTDDLVTGRVAGFVGIIALLGVLVGVGVTVRALTLPASCSKCKMVVAYDQLADGLREAGFEDGTIYAYDYPTQVSGNLRRFFPDSRFVSYKFKTYTPPSRKQGSDRESGQCLAVWLQGAGDQSPSADAIKGHLSKRLGVTPSAEDAMQSVDIQLPGRSEPLTYGYILIDDPERQGACR